ncbi:MAG: 23S rRNA (adenine(2030)-N(6))-methyltransferase RlmJ [Gemmatales bacterium]|nr:23S rRNA (adenine(2030)-N(6))-methyltransferase RlmJ [Gemmatales bacterium]MDW8223993.1 RsmD family RNA methyltransferase [Gemmatales bacterium]
MPYYVRIIGGDLRGRRLRVVTEPPELRPIADRAREALFNILRRWDAGRLFVDVFAGSGSVGIEALSRGAKHAVFVEKHPRLVALLEEQLQQLGLAERATVLRADAYRWAERWTPSEEAVNVFLGPPYADFVRRSEALHQMIRTLQQKLPPDSVLIVQTDTVYPADQLPDSPHWDVRRYGRTQLCLWHKKQDGSA